MPNWARWFKARFVFEHVSFRCPRCLLCPASHPHTQLKLLYILNLLDSKPAVRRRQKINHNCLIFLNVSFHCVYARRSQLKLLYILNPLDSKPAMQRILQNWRFGAMMQRNLAKWTEK